MLSDGDILNMIQLGCMSIEPLVYENIQPASLDVRLGDTLKVHGVSSKILDPQDPDDSNISTVSLTERGYALCPGDFAIGTTVESVSLGHRIVARLEGKSSLARLGLVPHVAAGFIDPGFAGQITLELKNEGRRPILLRNEMFIGQLAFTKLDSPCAVMYGDKRLRSRYQGQSGPTLSRGISSGNV